jgi:hypothetical protein
VTDPHTWVIHDEGLLDDLDPRLAESLIAYLADNALRYNAPGGWAEVSTAFQRLGRNGSRAPAATGSASPLTDPRGQTLLRR